MKPVHGNFSTGEPNANNIGQVYYHQGDHKSALRCYNESISISKTIGDKAKEAATLFNMSIVHENLSDFKTAIRLLEQVILIDEALEPPDLEDHRTAVRMLERSGKIKAIIPLRKAKKMMEINMDNREN